MLSWTLAYEMEAMTTFLKQDYANNLYFFSYLEEQGGRTRVHALCDDGEIILALLVSEAHCAVSSRDLDTVSRASRNLPPIHSRHILGRRDHTEVLLSAVSGTWLKKDYTFCQYQPLVREGLSAYQSQPIQQASLAELAEFYAESSMLFKYEARLPVILRSGSGFYTGAEKRVVSCALTTTETDEMAMIGAVYTEPEWRGRGLASDCVGHLASFLNDRQKEAYLFYETKNLNLRSLYGNLGFQQCGEWLMAIRMD